MNVAGAMSRNAMILGVFAACTTALVAWTMLATKDDIAAAVRAAEAQQLLAIFPPNTHNNDLLESRFPLTADTVLLELRSDRWGYRAMRGTQTVGIILPATARDGYSGDIELTVGVRLDGSLAGVRVLSHRETPGLGDAIDLRKSPWVLDFDGRSLEAPTPDKWSVRKDGGEFDQFTGATITPRAVVQATRRVLEYTRLHHEALFGETNSSVTDKPDSADTKT